MITMIIIGEKTAIEGPAANGIHMNQIKIKMKTKDDFKKKYHFRDGNGFISSTIFSPSRILKNFFINYHCLRGFK